ncbi:MAG: hypothetical protein G01um101425_257 [Candidatus Peregrinibacteria bacterium Gr01-1014_25]|nr:MAG: hypothetical protein G01um101425_257 [Candidatus Peregrinibacteria bacterium Gr01-1014_25]
MSVRFDGQRLWIGDIECRRPRESAPGKTRPAHQERILRAKDMPDGGALSLAGTTIRQWSAEGKMVAEWQVRLEPYRRIRDIAMVAGVLAILYHDISAPPNPRLAMYHLVETTWVKTREVQPGYLWSADTVEAVGNEFIVSGDEMNWAGSTDFPNTSTIPAKA